jgi:hypothetical protein
MARRGSPFDDVREAVEDPDKGLREAARIAAEERKQRLAEEREDRLREAQEATARRAELASQMKFEQDSWRTSVEESNKEADQFSNRGGVVDVANQRGPYGDVKEAKKIRRDEAGNPVYRPSPLKTTAEDPLEASSAISYDAEGRKMRGYRTSSGSYEYVDPTSEAAMADSVPAEMRPSIQPDSSGKVRVKPFEGDAVDYEGDPFASQRPEVRRAAQQAAEMRAAAEVGKSEERKRESQLNVQGATMLKDKYSKELTEKQGEFDSITRDDPKLGRVPLKGKEKDFGTLAGRIKQLQSRIESIDTKMDEENSRQAALEDRKLDASAESSETKKKTSGSPLIPGE